MKEDEELERIRRRKLRQLMEKIKAKQTKIVGKGVVTLTSSNFDDFLKNAEVPVLVDFWADWCMPCHIMAPVIEELAREYAGKALFAKLNVDQNMEIASRYNIMSIPYFILFKGGRPVERIVGAVGRRPLEDILNKYI